MFKLLKQVPTYAYFAVGMVGATATYLFYEPTCSYVFSSSANNKSSNRKIKQNKGELEMHPRGLINHRNECFINVILQSLASSKKVVEWLVIHKPQSSSLFDTLSKILALINRLETLESHLYDSQKSDFSDFNLNQDNMDFYAANHIKKALNQHNWHIRSSDEHDCHEFFHLMMDVLDDELTEINKSNKSLNFFGSLAAGSSSCSLRRNKNPFHGYLVSQFECLDCFYKYPLRLESFYSLSLMLPPQRSSTTPMTLFECINNYFKPEHLTEMKCENCNNSSLTKPIKKKGFIKRQAIAKLPECLCIQIQRNSWSDSNYGMIKQTNYVKFPLDIKIDDTTPKLNLKNSQTLQNLHTPHSSLLFKNISTVANNSIFSLKQVGLGGLLGGNTTRSVDPNSELLTGLSQNTTHSSYELRSAVVHYGNAHSGHFVAYRKYNKNWLMISDNDIKSVKETNLLNSNVYMLFYDKITNTI